jgi:hypothetical protein
LGQGRIEGEARLPQPRPDLVPGASSITFRISHSDRLAKRLAASVLLANIVPVTNMNTNKGIQESELNEFLTILSELQTIPAHDPDRFETNDGLDNPDCTNGDRADMALEALDCFQVACSMTEDVDTAASDLVCALLHLVHSHGFDPRMVLQSGLGHFICEAGCLEN